MNMQSSNPPAGRAGLVMASAVISIALIVCSLIGASALVKVKSLGQSISVTGAAFKQIRSNYSIWDATVIARKPTMADATAQLKKDFQSLKDFLQSQGFDSSKYQLQPTEINKIINYQTSEVVSYELSRSIRIEMEDVDRMQQLVVAANSLVDKGVELRSNQPQYLFTGIDDVKLEMIEAATANARDRAEKIATSTDTKIGAPVSASVGVFQICPLHSQEVSSYGISDVTSIDKEIVSTVHMEFLID